MSAETMQRSIIGNLKQGSCLSGIAFAIWATVTLAVIMRSVFDDTAAPFWALAIAWIGGVGFIVTLGVSMLASSHRS